MSGRKYSEVKDMLDSAENVRKEGNKAFWRCLDNGMERIRLDHQYVEECHGQIQKTTYSISTDCVREFPKESENLRRQIEALRAEAYSSKYLDYLARAEEGRRSIKKRLKKADEEGEEIRNSIEGRAHYLTPEFERAENLVSKYKKIRKDRAKMVKEMDHTVKASNEQRIRFQNAVQQMQQLLEAVGQIEEKTGQVLRLRSQAGEAKEFLKKSLAEIGQAAAKKFMAQEYTDLQQQIDAVMRMADADVVNNLSAASERIGIFRTELEQRCAAFEEERQKTQAAVRQLEGLLEENGYYDPVDYLNHPDQAKKIILLSYIKKYGDRNALVNEIQNGIQEAKNACFDEAFTKAQKLAEETDEKIHQAMEYAENLQENMLKNAYATVDICNVMGKFSFNVDFDMIDGNPKNGWKIVARQGGETIRFDKVYVGEDGKPEIAIDHTILPGASCSTRWEDISKQMDKKGIFIQKICTEDGGVVLDRNGGRKMTAGPNPEPIPVRKSTN